MLQGVVGGISEVVDRTDEFRQGPKHPIPYHLPTFQPPKPF